MEAVLTQADCSPIQDMSNNSPWPTVRQHLELLLGQDVLANWFSKVDIAAVDGGMITLRVPSTFTGEYILSNFSEEIVASCSHSGLKAYGAAYRVAARRPEAGAPEVGAAERKMSVAPTDLRGLKLNTRYTFDSFVAGEANGQACDTARRIARGNFPGLNSLYIYGHVGLGKTHLLNAICWLRKSSFPELKLLLMSGDLFMDQYVRAVTGKRLIEFREQMRSIDLLVVDDIQFIEGRRGTTEELDSLSTPCESRTDVLSGRTG